VAVLLALAMCRLAARSDDALDAALAERLSVPYPAEQQDAPVDGDGEQSPLDPRRGDYRATG